MADNKNRGGGGRAERGNPFRPKMTSAQLTAAQGEVSRYQAQQTSALNTPSIGSKVRIPQGFQYGMGKLKQPLTGRVSLITHQSDNSPVYRIITTMPNGKERIFDLSGSQITRGKSGFMVKR